MTTRQGNIITKRLSQSRTVQLNLNTEFLTIALLNSNFETISIRHFSATRDGLKSLINTFKAFSLNA